MITLEHNQSCQDLYAVSYDSVTFRDLQYFVQEYSAGNRRINRVDPEQFLINDDKCSGHYLNLINKDMQLRERVSQHIDLSALPRWSFVHPSCIASDAVVSTGCMIYPMVVMYTRAQIDRDIIIHSSAVIAHDVRIEQGSYISIGVKIAGSSRLGRFCHIGTSSVIADNIFIADRTRVGIGSLVRESVTLPGVYVNRCHSHLDRLK